MFYSKFKIRSDLFTKPPFLWAGFRFRTFFVQFCTFFFEKFCCLISHLFIVQTRTFFVQCSTFLHKHLLPNSAPIFCPMLHLLCPNRVPGNTRPGGVREDLLGPGNTSPGVRVTQVREDTSPGNTSPGDSWQLTGCLGPASWGCQTASAPWVWALRAQTQGASAQRRARLNLT